MYNEYNIPLENTTLNPFEFRIAVVVMVIKKRPVVDDIAVAGGCAALL